MAIREGQLSVAIRDVRMSLLKAANQADNYAGLYSECKTHIY